jgi:hypothetical protein
VIDKGMVINLGIGFSNLSAIERTDGDLILYVQESGSAEATTAPNLNARLDCHVDQLSDEASFRIV